MLDCSIRRQKLPCHGPGCFIAYLSHCFGFCCCTCDNAIARSSAAASSASMAAAVCAWGQFQLQDRDCMYLAIASLPFAHSSAQSCGCCYLALAAFVVSACFAQSWLCWVIYALDGASLFRWCNKRCCCAELNRFQCCHRQHYAS